MANGYFTRYVETDGMKTKGYLILRGFSKEELDIEARKQIQCGWTRVKWWEYFWAYFWKR